MNIGHLDADSRVVVIAEIGNNHEGSLELAEKLIHLAAEAGADVVKFQTIVPEKLVSPSQVERIAQLRRLCLPLDAFSRLQRVAAEAGVLFLSTPFDCDSVGVLNPMVPAFKVASGDNDFFPLLETIAATGKPVLLSTGMTDLAAVAAARTCLEAAWHAHGVTGELALLHCVSSYPTPAEDANLGAIAALAGPGVTVGYSDHTLGIEACVLAVALGARIIEKHFTIDKACSSFRDHQLSADPVEFATMVRRIREAEVMLGTGRKVPLQCEAGVAGAARRSAVAAADLPAGTVIASDHVLWVRPAGGIAPSQAQHLVGRVLRTGVTRGDMFAAEHIEGGLPCAV